nr:DNA helicase [Tanacetum cinerariifolium]
MKTKRKLVPKTIVIGSVRETGYLDVRGSCSGNVVERESAIALVDNSLTCSIVGIVNKGQKVSNSSRNVSLVDRQTGFIDSRNLPLTDVVCDVHVGGRHVHIINDRQTGSVDSRNLSLIADVVRDVDVGSHSYGSSRIAAQMSALLYENQKCTGVGIFTGNNVGGSGGPPIKRQHMCFDHGNQQLLKLNNDTVADREFVGVTGTSPIYIHLVKIIGASSGQNQKRSRGVTSRIRESSHSGSSSSTRRHLSVNHRNLNTSNLNSNSTSIIASSTQHEAHTCPLSEYKYIGKCEHSCEHCGARFWYEERVKDNRKRNHPAFHRCCMAGRVVICSYQIYPEYIKLLLRDRHFIENIRAYNQMFSMASLGARIDETVNVGQGPYVFKISSQLYHWLGSLCPEEGDPPRFLQLYVYDTQNEVNNRMSYFGGDVSDLRRDIVKDLIELLDNHNALVQLFRTAREKLLNEEVPSFKVRLYSVVGAREYELPTRDTLGAVVYESGPDTDMDYDIVIEERFGQSQRVNKLHPSYMALQFPLLFIYGEHGYSKEMKMVSVPGASSSEDRRLTMKAYYSYMLHDHVNLFNYLSKTGQLFQQYMVTAFCAVEQNRSDWVREHQNDIRNDYLSGIYDTINLGDSDGSDSGGKLILPQSFTGGPRYMYVHYLDALAICRVHGNLSYFITFTCNVKWPEIVEYMEDFLGLTTADRADVVDRVFKMKIRQFVKYLQDIKPFGKIIAIVYTVEFQKQGLPHCHTLIWVDENSRIQNHEDIDAFISVVLPLLEVDPVCYRIVSKFMIHGPCGEICPSAACMKNGPKCAKYFSKEYCDHTYMDHDGFVHYRKRDTGATTVKQNVQLDNGYVVPYNKQLLKTFYAHINVEYCGWTMLIK